MVQRAHPNAGHRGIVELARRGHAVEVVTQNVDDLHERAGSRGVVHLHGSLFASRCLDCGTAVVPDPILAGLDALRSLDTVTTAPQGVDPAAGGQRR